MSNHVQLFCDFIQKSPSAFHACATLCEMLEAGGYTPLLERSAGALCPAANTM